MRILDFTGVKAAKRFEYCYMAVLNAGDGRQTRDMVTVRREARLLNAFDAASLERPDGELRPLQVGGAAVELLEDDWALLKTYLEKMQWAPRVAREAVDVVDFVASAQEKK